MKQHRRWWSLVVASGLALPLLRPAPPAEAGVVDVSPFCSNIGASYGSIDLELVRATCFLLGKIPPGNIDPFLIP